MESPKGKQDWGQGRRILDRDLGIGIGEVAGIQGRRSHPTLGVDRPRGFSAGFQITNKVLVATERERPLHINIGPITLTSAILFDFWRRRVIAKFHLHR